MVRTNAWTDFPFMYHSMAALSVFGGYFAYAKKGSRASLFGGLAVAAMYETSVWLFERDPQKQLYGLVGGTVASSVLAYKMVKRAAATGRPIPASLGAVAVIVGTASAYHAYKRVY